MIKDSCKSAQSVTFIHPLWINVVWISFLSWRVRYDQRQRKEYVFVKRVITMTSATLDSHIQLSSDSAVWDSLKQAIAKSSGFKCWQEEQISEQTDLSSSLDIQVRDYLRQTLETLAY